MSVRNTEVGSTASRIRASREKVGISPSEFARRVGVTPTCVHNWEKEHHPTFPRQPTLGKVLEVLQVSEEFLRNGNTSAPSPQTSNTQRSVAEVLDRAREQIALCVGVPKQRIRVTVEVTS